jgi:protein TonB
MLYILGFSCLTCFGQEKTPHAIHTSVNEPITKFGETEPQFPGGAAELQRYIMKSFPWDSIRGEDLLEVSKIYLSFVVTKTGEIKQLQILKGSHPNIDPLIFKFVSDMPLWIPGKNEKDEPINMEVRLPIQVCLK